MANLSFIVYLLLLDFQVVCVLQALVTSSVLLSIVVPFRVRQSDCDYVNGSNDNKNEFSK